MSNVIFNITFLFPFCHCDVISVSRLPQETSRLTENECHVKACLWKNWAEITVVCVCVCAFTSVFFGPVDDVVDKSDDNEESDSENDTDNEDAEKDQCTDVRHTHHFIPL